MNQRDIEYALAKQVPDMARGFTIHTNYGDIVIEAGWMATWAAKMMMVAFTSQQREDEARHARTKGGRDRHGFSLEAEPIGGSYAHRQEVSSEAAASCTHCGASLCPVCRAVLPCATPQTPGGHQ